jgi:4'-phosphopantetheinyl transferase
VTALSANPSSVSDALAPPGHGQLHLWLARREAVADSDFFIRDLLSRYTGRAPAALAFCRGPQGKPSLRDPCASLAFNFSDSAGWLALAVSDGPEVGVDLEYCDSARDVLKLARRCFTPAEIADLAACDSGRRCERFYDYWTLKEARVKAQGLALGPALASLVFELDFPAGAPGEGGAGTISEAVPGEPLGAHYCLLDLAPGYRLATCWLKPAGILPRLRLFHWCPAAGARLVVRPLRATSAPVELPA